MSDTTARLALPMIVPGQAQKEMTHNEALVRLDIAVQACVQSDPLDMPPAAPDEGDCWIVGAAPTGAWAGQEGAIAAWTAGGWRFVAPRPGYRVWISGEDRELRFVNGTWNGGAITGERLVLDGIEMLAAPVPAISDPAGGADVDAQARDAVAAILAALRHHNLIETV